MSYALSYAPKGHTVLSAILIVLSFPPFDFSFLIWFALIPWFSGLSRTSNRKETLLQGIWLSILMTLGGYYWIAYALNEFGSLPWVISIFGLLLFSVIGQPQFPIFALLWRNVKFPAFHGWCGTRTILVLALLYTGIDWILPKLFLDTLGHCLYNAPILRQAADLGGASLLTFLIYLVNQSLWSLLQFFRLKKEPSLWPALQGAWPQCLLAFFIFFTFIVYGIYRMEQIHKILENPQGHLQTAVIQANIGDFEKIAAEHGVREAAEKVMETFFTLSDRALTLRPKPDVLIWPETSYPSAFRTPQTANEFARDQMVESYVRARNIPLLFGGYDHSQGKDFNAFFFLNPTPINTLAGKGDLQIYRKNILLLFGEYIPGAEWFPFIKNAFPQVGNFGRGPGPSVFNVYLESSSNKPHTILVNPIICYEALFPNFILDAVKNGSQIILNITNDSWFGPRGEPNLHLALTAFRSIESRRPQIRTTNTGFSALILPTGEIVNQSGLGTQEVLNLRVPILPKIKTLMLTLGDWFGWFSLTMGAIFYFWYFWRFLLRTGISNLSDI